MDDLRDLGELDAVASLVKKEVESLKIAEGLSFLYSPGNWENLFDVVTKFLKLEASLSSGSEANDDGDDYFRSRESKIYFALLELEGESRNEVLGITDEHFYSASAAKKWRREITTLIHPDKSDHPLANLATQQINKLYRLMTK